MFTIHRAAAARLIHRAAAALLAGALFAGFASAQPTAPARPAASVSEGARPGIPTPAHAAAQPHTLYLFNREIATLRSPLGGLDPRGRALRAEQRFAQLDGEALAEPVRQTELVTDGLRGISLQAGSKVIFTLLTTDLDPEERLSLQLAADVAASRLAGALVARQRQNGPNGWWPGLATTFGVLIGWSVALLLGLWLRGRWAAPRGTGEDGPEGAPAARAVLRTLGVRLADGALWGTLGVLLFAGVYTVLSAFAWTEPWSARLGEFVSGLLVWIAASAVNAIPGLVTILAIAVVVRVLQDVLNSLLSGVQSGSLRVPFLHPETIGATRRLLALLIWGLALAAAYPYLPGSDSDAFKGLSVLLGLMITLGSSSTVTQLMSGLVVVYSRSLKRGDYVSVNGVEGVVSEVGALAVKLKTMRNEEVTLPNAVIVANPIHNYSKLAGQQGTLLSTRLTIGYDTPWRQVHALLTQAAGETAGLRSLPAPFVRQRALGDFYVEYELFAHIDQPLERVSILSALHERILDAFNRGGVQIMSPHFVDQPRKPVLVPVERWHDPAVAENPPDDRRAGATAPGQQAGRQA